ncbi:DUF6082 family protein [Dactylosporangium sucinum]|uniref:Uncharacterized protein n=1 Tax=Dactylosporangium sucinum TaxID=1424081 RepID=A0A917TNB6_9ACTN|nr:DUF6082 family protein [Dactylosporangium sucinum]GGM29632.1 hypothetical protein GCM10007977_033650 [Dactylosporangium sucinum]
MKRSPATTVASVTALSAVLVVLVVASPLLLAGVGSASVDWHLLADVGQAYGATTAVLSGLAFCGVAVSLLLQWRQNRITQVHSLRQRHFELVRLALDDHRYLFVEGRRPASDPDAVLKVYANLTVSHWAMCWDMDAMTEDAVRAGATRLFESALAREWWQEYWPTYLKSRRRRAFVDLLTAACAQAAARDAAEPVPDVAPDPAPASASRSRRRSTDRAVAVVIGATLGAAVALYLSRRRGR